MIPAIEQVNSESGRFYRTPDGDFPSITTVLGSLSKGHIEEWRNRVGAEHADKITRQAANRGTRLHSNCETYLKTGNINATNPFDLMMFRSIQPKLDLITQVHYQETAMWSKELGVAGTVDCIGEYGNELAVIDFKSANKEKKLEWIDSYWLQTCAYSIMYEERTGTRIDKLVIIIANEEETAQSFVDWRNNWEDRLKEVIDSYRKTIYNVSAV